ncbi:hypothetical protein SAMN05660284_02375 [Formivibrio citricus]|uniref:Uncharacterized protein n=1 Tax=Formivibrio citricus TaxID=83765 RepID=A0A1I5CCB6_9NEIS|nr:hypothetical protein [Formivibrio citricus]SFN84629.1 hypothetical protein SAMN05660284_02375 [Formivibrio citricus]
MAESRNSAATGASPLFDKMDALMRKHRGGSDSANGIPVLTEEAIEFDLEVDHIPVLTEEFSHDGLMFDPSEFCSPPPPAQPAPAPVAATPPRSEPPAVQFLDLPLLDLDVDEPPPAAAPAVIPAVEIEEIELPAFEVLEGGDWPDEVTPPLQTIAEPAAEPASAVEAPCPDETVPQVPSIGFAPEPVTVMELGEDSFAAPELEISLPAEPAARLEEVAERPAMTSLQSAEPAEEELTLTELPEAPAPQILTLDAAEPEPVAAVAHAAQPLKLDDAAVAEITASVAAQIAVDISTEVAQLTRQHFTSMMNSFYGEALRKVTEEISRDMEMCLAPRIADLVQDELRRKGVAE